MFCRLGPIVFLTVSFLGSYGWSAKPSSAIATQRPTQSPAPGQAQVPPTSLPTLLAEVRELTLKNNRAEAVTKLIQFVRSEKKDSSRYRDALKNLELISETFVTEEAQARYELGRSLTVTDAYAAESRFREALEVEPDNEAIVVAVARAELAQGHCDKVLSDTQDASQKNPFSRKMATVRLQALACLQKGSEFRTLLASSPADLSQLPYSLLLELSRAQMNFFDDKLPAALTALEKAKSLDPQMPEVYYWMGQVLEKMKKDDSSVYRKFVDLCQEAQEKRRRFFDTEPRTCSERKSIEKQLEARSMKSVKE